MFFSSLLLPIFLATSPVNSSNGDSGWQDQLHQYDTQLRALVMELQTARQKKYSNVGDSSLESENDKAISANEEREVRRLETEIKELLVKRQELLEQNIPEENDE